MLPKSISFVRGNNNPGVDFINCSMFLDLDGPILDVSERYFRVHQDVLRSMGSLRVTISKTQYWRMKRSGQPLGQILPKLSDGHIEQAAFLNEWRKRIERPEYLQFDTVIPGVRKRLHRLKERFNLVLVSLRQNKHALGTQLDSLELTNFFSCILSRPPLQSDSWKVKRDLIASSGLLSTGNWIIGDTEVDILAGKSLAMKTIAVLSGIRNSAALKEVAPDFIVKDLSHLPPLD